MKRNGMILAVVLWITVILAVICVSISVTVFQNQVQLKISRSRDMSEDARREFMGQVGEILIRDPASSDTPDETWASIVELQTSDGGFSMRLISPTGAGLTDESSLINANTASFEMLSQLDSLPDVTARKFVELREELQVRQQSDPNAPPAGLCGPIATPMQLAEMLELSFERTAQDTDADGSEMSDELRRYMQNSWMNGCGFGGRVAALMQYLTVYSRQRNVDSQGAARVNINTADFGELSARLGDVLSERQIMAVIDSRAEYGFESIGQLLTRQLISTDFGRGEISVSLTTDQFGQIADRITVSTSEILVGRINVNTATVEVLKTVEGISRFDAESIVNYRSSLSADQRHQLSNLAWILELISNESFAQASEYITTRSSQFSLTGSIDDESKQRSDNNKWIFAVFERDLGMANSLLYFGWSQKNILADN